ncbi:hypothetical protein C8Q78DRAFT_386881 [Trametes maxima]|nr:hypothetical protein C8Q78DRAFT_386881 [Trametes maxima]
MFPQTNLRRNSRITHTFPPHSVQHVNMCPLIPRTMQKQTEFFPLSTNLRHVAMVLCLDPNSPPDHSHPLLESVPPACPSAPNAHPLIAGLPEVSNYPQNPRPAHVHTIAIY